MNNPLVSILIPVYNREFLVIETIESALGQTYKNIEIIIVDNCSTDDTWNVLQDFVKKDDRIKIFQNSKNIGPVLNWKRCIDEASGEYAKILFSDDLISENFIEETLVSLINNPNIGFVISKVLLTNTSVELKNNVLNPMNKIKFYSRRHFIFSKIYGLGNFPNSPGCALFRTCDLKKSLFIQIPNKFNWDFSVFGAGNDLLIYLETANNYKKIIYTETTYSIFRGHKDSFSTSNSLKKYYDYSKYFFAKKNNYFVTSLILGSYFKIKYKNQK